MIALLIALLIWAEMLQTPKFEILLHLCLEYKMK